MADGNRPPHIWLLHGEGWSLPVVVQWFDDMGRIRLPDIPLTRPMKLALSEVIEKYGLHNGEDWWIVRQTLERIADEMPKGSDPEELVHWTRQIGRRVQLEQPPEMEGFYEDIAAQGYEFIETPGKAQLLWGILITHMLDRLVNQKKPVHLGFAVLQPLPFRPNWSFSCLHRLNKTIQAYMTNGSGITDRRYTPFQAYHAAMEKIKEWMTDDRLLVINKKDRRVHWTIHVKHLNGWWKPMIQVEKDRRRRRKGLAYWLDIKQEVKDRIPIVHEIFRDQASQARKPFPTFPKGAGYRSAKQNPFKKPDVVKLTSYGIAGSVGIVFDDRTGKRVPCCPQTAKGVSAVSYVRTAGRNVRKSGGTLEQPSNG